MKAKELHNSIISKINNLYEGREAQNLSFLVLEDFNVSKTDILLNNEINNFDEKKLESILQRLLKNEPLQHILGYSWFYGHQFKVNKHTLIPRPETEELVELILNTDFGFLPKILDIGTGSGCIPIALKLAKPQWQASGFDFSEKALEIAQENAQNLKAKVHFFQADVLQDAIDYSTYSVIVSNPPYITLNEKTLMSANVLDFEPHSALFVENDNPLLFCNRIVDIAVQNTNLKHLFFEINEHFAQETVELIQHQLPFGVRVIKDLQDKNRMIHAFKL